MKNRLLIAVAVCAAILGFPIAAFAADGVDGGAAIPVGAGAGGITLGGGVVYLLLHGRIKSAEEQVKSTAKTLADVSSKLPGLMSQISNLVRDVEQLAKSVREDTTSTRGKIHDTRNALQKHEGRIIRLEERHNAMRDALAIVAGSDIAVPRPITEDVTGPMNDPARRTR